MKKKTATIFMATLFSIYLITGTIMMAKASPPVPTAFYLESRQVTDDIKVEKVVGNLILVKAFSYHNILVGDVGTITLNVVLIVDLETGNANFSGAFVITATNSGTIHGRVEATIIDFFGDYETEGTFAGGGDMKISGTLETPSGKMGNLVWDGISW